MASGDFSIDRLFGTDASAQTDRRSSKNATEGTGSNFGQHSAIR
jgi:hypothetical protein